MCRDDQPASFIDQPVACENVSGRANFCAALGQPVNRHVEAQQQQFEDTQRSFRRENRQNVEPEGGGKLNSRQHQEFVAQAAEFVQVTALLWSQAIVRFQPGQALDLGPEMCNPLDRVVVGNGHDVEAPGLCFLEPLQISNAWLQPIRRCGGVQM